MEALNIYDKHETRPNITEQLTASQISEETKSNLLKKCSEEHKAKIKVILFDEE